MNETPAIPNSPQAIWAGTSPASLRILDLAEKTAETDTTLLITGESGTGKDQLARLIHQRSSRREAPLLKIDCASLPGELVESELFGHERGAFTGAIGRKPGRFELAQSGTIVLDEVAALAPGIQAKLLRILEERTFERLGGTETLRINARIIALTNADLAEAVAAGRFREDLFFRLNVLSIAIPPLRERREDIAPLARHFVGRLGPVHGHVAMIDEPALSLLQSYDWPGNARELKNAIEHGLIFSDDKTSPLTAADFSDIAKAVGSSAVVNNGLRSLEDLQREAIQTTLEKTHYKIARAAEILGISRKTLLDKRKKYGLI
jgi:two-component system response regulator AtoC